jgi:hypothetical protein
MFWILYLFKQVTVYFGNLNLLDTPEFGRDKSTGLMTWHFAAHYK